MAGSDSPLDLVDCSPDERLLGPDMAKLPLVERRAWRDPPDRARRALVAAGATLTAAALIGGIALIGFGVVDAIASGFGALDAVAIGIGAVLVATHWGWVHVAELAANRLAAQRARELRERSAGWLEAVKPYTRYSVQTTVLDDGSIAIERTRHRAVRVSDRTFSFVSEPVAREVHGADEPAASVSERAETLRRDAALDTERERQRFDVAADAYERALFDRDDERERAVARRAASAALSDELNAKLRDPPLSE